MELRFLGRATSTDTSSITEYKFENVGYRFVCVTQSQGGTDIAVSLIDSVTSAKKCGALRPAVVCMVCLVCMESYIRSVHSFEMARSNLMDLHVVKGLYY